MGRRDGGGEGLCPSHGHRAQAPARARAFSRTDIPFIAMRYQAVQWLIQGVVGSQHAPTRRREAASQHECPVLSVVLGCAPDAGPHAATRHVCLQMKYSDAFFKASRPGTAVGSLFSCCIPRAVRGVHRGIPSHVARDSRFPTLGSRVIKRRHGASHPLSALVPVLFFCQIWKLSVVGRWLCPVASPAPHNGPAKGC